MKVQHAHRSGGKPEHPRLVARFKYHVDGEHTHPHRAESPNRYYSCIWCNWPSAVTNPEVEIETVRLPSDYPGGIGAYFKSYQDALR